MADTPRTNVVARQMAESRALHKTFQRISDCELFRDALTAYEYASADVRACTDESKPQRAAAEVLDTMMADMVYAVADYHCAHVLFDVLILQALGPEDEDDDD